MHLNILIITVSALLVYMPGIVSFSNISTLQRRTLITLLNPSVRETPERRVVKAVLIKKANKLLDMIEKDLHTIFDTKRRHYRNRKPN